MANHDRGSDATDRRFMELAIDEMAKSDGDPKVGAVLVGNGVVVAQAHRDPGTHAERGAIMKVQASGIDPKGSTLYTTLEPCTRLSKNHESCAELIARVGISTVVIGRYDAHPIINRLGWRSLRDAGITLRDFDADLRERIDSMNTSFTDFFAIGHGPSGGAKFDYTVNGGRFEFQFSEDDARSIITHWGRLGPATIQTAATPPAKAAAPKYVTNFGQIDDPSAHDFAKYWQHVDVGHVAVFMSEGWAVLAKVLEVKNGDHAAGWGQPSTLETSVKIEWEMRSLR